MHLRRRRRTLAGIVVRQWKWFARDALRQLRARQQETRLVVARAHHRATLLSKTLHSLRSYATHRRRSREGRVADVWFLNRPFLRWRSALRAAGEARRQQQYHTLQTSFAGWRQRIRQEKIIRRRRRNVFAQWRRNTTLRRALTALRLFVSFSRLRGYSTVKRTSRLTCADLLYTRHSTIHAEQAFSLWHAKWTALRQQRLRLAFSSWRAVVTAAQLHRRTLCRAGLTQWKTAHLQQRHDVRRERRVWKVWRGAVKVAALQRSGEEAVRRRVFGLLRVLRLVSGMAGLVELRVMGWAWRRWYRYAHNRATEMALRVHIQTAKMRTPADNPAPKPRRAHPRPLPAPIAPSTSYIKPRRIETQKVSQNPSIALRGQEPCLWSVPPVPSNSVSSSERQPPSMRQFRGSVILKPYEKEKREKEKESDAVKVVPTLPAPSSPAPCSMQSLGPGPTPSPSLASPPRSIETQTQTGTSREGSCSRSPRSVSGVQGVQGGPDLSALMNEIFAVTSLLSQSELRTASDSEAATEAAQQRNHALRQRLSVLRQALQPMCQRAGLPPSPP